MHHPAIPGPEVDRRDERLAGEVRGHDEAPVHVRTRGRDREILGRLEDQVGLAQLPLRGKRNGRRQVLGVPLRGAGLGPGFQDGDLRGRERLVVLELRAHPRRGLPGGHHPVAGDDRDIRRALPRCSYVSSENGPTWFLRWQFWHFLCRIGATSFVNVGAPFAAAFAVAFAFACGDSSPPIPARSVNSPVRTRQPQTTMTLRAPAHSGRRRSLTTHTHAVRSLHGRNS